MHEHLCTDIIEMFERFPRDFPEFSQSLPQFFHTASPPPKKKQKTNWKTEAIIVLWCRYQAITKPYELDVPKNHLIFHINDRAGYLGNPWSYAAFIDESLNKKLKACLQLCHQTKFESRAFQRISAVLAETLETR